MLLINYLLEVSNIRINYYQTHDLLESGSRLLDPIAFFFFYTLSTRFTSLIECKMEKTRDNTGLYIHINAELGWQFIR